jgi:hypothetical protein
LLAISSLVALCSSSFGEVQFAPADEHFSAAFPGQPDKRTTEMLGIKSTMYGSKNGDKLFAVAHMLWPTELDPLAEVQSMIDGLVERISAELLSIEKTTITSASGKGLAAKKFTFASAKVWGEALIVVSGQHSYMVSVVMRKPSEGLDDAGRQFFSSFRVLN